MGPPREPAPVAGAVNPEPPATAGNTAAVTDTAAPDAGDTAVLAAPDTAAPGAGDTDIALPAGVGVAARRRRWVLVVGLAAALLSVGGLIGASFVRSPEQQRASTEAPAPSVLTAEVEQRVLASTVVIRGTVAAARQVEATPVSAQEASVMVVTAIQTKVGARVDAGDVVLSVSGRPLMALPGPVPAYRDMRPGDQGRDIQQLQRALRTLGHYRSADRAGHFGPGTKAAVRRLYESVGFSVPSTASGSGGDEDTALRAARDQVDAAEQALVTLRARLAATEPQPGEPSEAAQLATARRAVTRAKDALARLVARTGPMVPLAEVVFLPSFPATVSALGAKLGDQVEAPLITFATGALGVTGRLQPEQASLLRAGMRVEIVSESVQDRATGKVTAVGALTTDRPDGEQDGQGPAGAAYVPVTVTPDKPLPTEWNGLDVRLTVTAAQTDGEVLVVPLSAVSAAADGRTTVTVVDGGGEQTRVEVRPGVSGDGFVEVSVVDGELAAGDRVVVGR